MKWNEIRYANHGWGRCLWALSYGEESVVVGVSCLEVERTDGWMHGWMHGWMDGQTSGCGSSSEVMLLSAVFREAVIKTWCVDMVGHRMGTNQPF
mmetsp:Transcript_11170/g.13214  ORF Transcript_11170/g.13214 Transcript_11170/m.13214 type:complete len:95 (+) Transcript_11170:116-400(+)